MYFAKKSRENQKRNRPVAHIPKGTLEHLEHDLDQLMKKEVGVSLLELYHHIV